MGHTHNRKRTRSRPRSRNLSLFEHYAPASFTSDSCARSALVFTPASLAPIAAPMATPALPAGHAFGSRKARRRTFGTDYGDEDNELCGPMLDVVRGLWGGLDFDDDE